MARSMTRWALAGCMALAALSAAAVLDVGLPTAEAAPSESPFAGTYVASYWPSPIKISNGGRITSSYSYSGGSKGSISGQVSADGSYSFTVSESYFEHGPREHGRHTYGYVSVGNMAPDAAGNIVGTPNSGGSFLWLLQ